MMSKFLFLKIAFLLFVGLTNGLLSFSQVVNHKIMYWNLLNYPDILAVSADTALRHPFYRTVVHHVNPDILVTGENTLSSAADFFLNQVLNINGVIYSKGIFLTGQDTNNGIYFKSSLFSFVSNKPIRTNLRDISEFTLVHTGSGDTLRIYAVHLKASQGSPNDTYRAAEVDSLRKVTNQLPDSSNFIVCGDFNIYGSLEPAYQKLLQDNLTDDGEVNDPISMSGTWNNSIYSSHHTQSTRTTGFGGGATGGLNDRFDMILFSDAIDMGLNGIQFVSGSTLAVGNDGNHYNQSIVIMPNTSVPSNVLNALYNASDHLPVVAEFTFSNPSTINDLKIAQVKVFPNPCIDHLAIELISTESKGRINVSIKNIVGQECLSQKLHKVKNQYSLSEENIQKLSSGVYFISITNGEFEYHSKLIKH